MLMLSMRLNKKVISFAAALAGALILAAAGRLLSAQEASVDLNGNGAVVKNVTAASNEDRLAFIGQFGWEVDAEPEEIEEVLIPREFDTVYQEYNALQKAQGLDLARYRGKTAKRFCYRVRNHPDGKDDIRLNLLVAENRVIGGDVHSAAADGFIHGFAYDEKIFA